MVKALALSAKSLQRSRGFESLIWHFLYKMYFNVAQFCLKVLSEPRRVTLPTGNNLEIMSLNLAPRVVFITPDRSLFSRWPCVASRIALYEFISLSVMKDRSTFLRVNSSYNPWYPYMICPVQSHLSPGLFRQRNFQL